MRIARNLLGLSDDDLAEIRDALLVLSNSYLETYMKATKASVPPPYFRHYIEHAKHCLKLMKRFQ